MKTFHCDHCQALLFFESTQCLNCDHVLAYAPSFGDCRALMRRMIADSVRIQCVFTSALPGSTGRFVVRNTLGRRS